MNKRKLGNSAIEVAPLVFGGNVFGWTLDEKSSFEMLDGLVDMGINMIDTADVYSAWASGNKGGESETIIGNWLKNSGKRNKVVIATKVGMQMGNGSQGLAKNHIIKSAEESLKRLNTDHIDLYYAHKDDETVPLEESLSAFETLIKDGKIGAIASSNYSAERLEQALNISRDNSLPRFIAHQPEFNLFDRNSYEGALETTCVKNELGVVTYFSLASGFLTGKYRNQQDVDQAKRGKDAIQKYMTDRGLRIIDALDTVAKQHNVKPATVALAWIIHHPSVTAPIASATNLEQLKELTVAAQLNLSDQDIALLNQASEA